MPGGVQEVYGYSEVLYPDIYPDIDMRFYGTGLGQKLSFICWPESNPEVLALQFTGLDSLGLTVDSLLRIYMDGAYVDLPEAVAYQVDANNEIIPILWRPNWKLVTSDIVAFEFEERDPDLPIVLQIGPGPRFAQEVSDMPPCWGTLLGGTQTERVYASTTDDDGNYYVAGTTTWNSQFPDGPLSVTYATGSAVIYLTRFDPAHFLFWTIYYGGDGSQFPTGLAVRNDPIAEIYVGGTTFAGNLFLLNEPGGYMDSTGTGGQANGLLAKFNINAVCLLSTYFGNQDTQVTDIAIDDQDRLFLSGFCEFGDVPFPTTQPVGAFVQAYSVGVDGFVVGLDANDDLRWATFVGDAGYDEVRSIRIVDDRLIAVGYTSSPEYQPILDGGVSAFDQDSLIGASDISVAEFDLDGGLHWGTLICSPGFDLLDANEPLALNKQGDVYLIGTSSSMNFPVVADSGWVSLEPSEDWLLSFAHEDRSLQWSTPIAGHSPFNPRSIITDDTGNVFVAGGIADSTAVNLELPGFYFQEQPNTGAPGSLAGALDGYLMAFSSEHWPVLATYVGGDEWGGITEEISTLAWSADFLYSAGVTPWLYVPDTSYFPVFNPGSPAWFEDVYTGGASDAFVMAFCNELFTALSEAPDGEPAGNGITIATLGPHQWRMDGLDDGRHQLAFFDVAGHLVHSRILSSANGRSEPFTLSQVAPGVYLGVCTEAMGRAFRIVVDP